MTGAITQFFIEWEGHVLQDTGADRRFLSEDIVHKHFYFKILHPVFVDVWATNRQQCQILRVLRLQQQTRRAKIMCSFLVMQHLGCVYISGRNFDGTKVYFDEKYLLCENLDDAQPSQAPLPVPKWDNSSLDYGQQKDLMAFFGSFCNPFSEELGRTTVLQLLLKTDAISCQR